MLYKLVFSQAELFNFELTPEFKSFFNHMKFQMTFHSLGSAKYLHYWQAVYKDENSNNL